MDQSHFKHSTMFWRKRESSTFLIKPVSFIKRKDLFNFPLWSILPADSFGTWLDGMEFVWRAISPIAPPTHSILEMFISKLFCSKEFPPQMCACQQAKLNRVRMSQKEHLSYLLATMKIHFVEHYHDIHKLTKAEAFLRQVTG